MESTVTPEEALARLREGNERFAANVRSIDSLTCTRAGNEKGQSPFAIILGCSDSRSPAEHVFDQGLGSLFVIRVAGNIVAPSQVASVEFAVQYFGTPLVVVMGHTHCGAIGATIEAMQQGAKSTNLASIVDRIRPSVAPLLKTPLAEQPAELAKMASRANVKASAHHLRFGSALLEEQILSKKLQVVGAEHDIATGVVDFFDL